MTWQVGEKSYGYGHGFFGDNYGTKTCIATGFYGGKNWALFHSEGFDGGFNLLAGDDLDWIEDTKTEDETNA